jgi:hypothetical protein
MSVIAGWCFLGLEALISDVGGVFGNSGKSCHRFFIAFVPRTFQFSLKL